MSREQLPLELEHGAHQDPHTPRERRLAARRSTFRGGLASPVHRWFRLTPSFGPDLVQRALVDMKTEPGSVVLDPFAGAGTTLVEAKLAGHTPIGFEINPLLHFVCQTTTRWDLDLTSLRSNAEAIEEHYLAHYTALLECPLEESGLPLPPIHNVFRWWRADVLKCLLILRQAIDRLAVDTAARSFFNLCLAGVLVPQLTNVTLGRLQLHFVDRSGDDIDVWAIFASHLRTMLFDLADVQARGIAERGDVYNTDSTQLGPSIQPPLVDRVVTSPPYPNRYSYVWNTRPHLYLLGFLGDAASAARLDLHTIGGTWGSATSSLAKGTITPAHPAVGAVVGQTVAKIRDTDNLMANYVMKYFNKLAAQIQAQHRLLMPDAQLAYVVGCSEIKGVYIETDVLLAQMFERLGLGYQVTSIERFRARNSGKDLHESTVYVRRR